MVSKSGKRGASSASSAAAAAAGSGDFEGRRFKGVRMRSWGKWVSEIRLPNTRARLWLGSFATAQQAARAFDVAVVCLRGRSATINFPDSPPVHAPLGLPLHKIQELAAAAAAAAAADSEPPNPGLSPAASSTSSSCPQPPFCTQSAEPAFSAGPTKPLTTISEPAPCSSPSYSFCSELEATTQSSDTTISAAQSEPAPCSSPSYSFCSEFEAATQSDTCSSACQSPEELQPLPWGCGDVADEQLCLGVQWDEMLWGSSLSSYTEWDQQLLTFPLLPPHDNLIEDFCLWSH